jgi:hypothetical protein
MRIDWQWTQSRNEAQLLTITPSPHKHFIEHLSCVTEIPPRKHNKKLGKLESWIRRLKNKTDFHLQESAIRHAEDSDSQKSRAVRSNQLRPSDCAVRHALARENMKRRRPSRPRGQLGSRTNPWCQGIMLQWNPMAATEHYHAWDTCGNLRKAGALHGCRRQNKVATPEIEDRHRVIGKKSTIEIWCAC